MWNIHSWRTLTTRCTATAGVPVRSESFVIRFLWLRSTTAAPGSGVSFALGLFVILPVVLVVELRGELDVVVGFDVGLLFWRAFSFRRFFRE